MRDYLIVTDHVPRLHPAVEAGLNGPQAYAVFARVKVALLAAFDLSRPFLAARLTTRRN